MPARPSPRPRPIRAIVLGDLVLDLVLSPDGPLRPGTDVAGRVAFRQGGSAATTARWFARLGLDAVLVTAVADDGLGDGLVAYMESCGVEVHATRVRGSHTGRLGVLVEAGDRSFVADRGAIHRLAPGHLRASWFSGARLLHVPAYSLVGDRITETAVRAARLASRAGAHISLDLSSAGFLASEGPERILARVAALRPDVILATRQEAMAATSEDGVERLLHLAPLVVVKEGAMGAAAHRRAGGPAVRSSARAARVRDTTGAGDAFDAGFLTALVTGVADLSHPTDRDLLRALGAGHRTAIRELTGRREELDATVRGIPRGRHRRASLGGRPARTDRTDQATADEAPYRAD